jgi:hypothetical protein
MEKFVAKVSIASPGVFILTLDKRKKIQVNGGSGEVSDSIDRGKHRIQWFVIGPEGTTYSVTISSPNEALIQVTRTLDESGQDANSFSFIIP